MTVAKGENAYSVSGSEGMEASYPFLPYPGPAGVGGPDEMCIPVIWLVT